MLIADAGISFHMVNTLFLHSLLRSGFGLRVMLDALRGLDLAINNFYDLGIFVGNFLDTGAPFLIILDLFYLMKINVIITIGNFMNNRSKLLGHWHLEWGSLEASEALGTVLGQLDHNGVLWSHLLGELTIVLLDIGVNYALVSFTLN